MNKKKLLKINTIMGLVYQIVAIICGFILPRLILSTYGSKTNGLVNSIQSFLSVITLMELGVGAVVQSSLYKPLAENDEEMVSRIIFSAKKFFKIVALSFSIFVIGVAVFYPIHVNGDFEIFTTVFLVISIAISLFAQYFFGIVYAILLKADQKVYVFNLVQIITIILNTIACAIMMIAGVKIEYVKFTTSMIFLLRPLFLSIYVRKHYNIYKLKPHGDEIPQKWNGIAQQLSTYVLENTDVIVLTIFASLSDVSIYSTYYLIVHSVRLLLVSLTNGVQSYYGYLIATNDNRLKSEFEINSYFINSITTIIFGVTIITIVPFVLWYTNGVNDADYNQYLFSFLLILGQYFYCFRRTFNLLIIAGGHFKQTQISAIIEAVINIVTSIILVFFFGIIGVAIGTIIAMLYRTIIFAYHCSKNFIDRSLVYFGRDLFVNLTIIIISIFLGFYVNKNIVISNIGYWIILGFVSTFIVVVLFILINLIFNHKNLKLIFKFKKNTL